MIDFEKYIIAEEGLFSRLAKKRAERDAQFQKQRREAAAKADLEKRNAVNVDDLYPKFHVREGDRDALRKAVFNCLVKEAEKIINGENRNIQTFIKNKIKGVRSSENYKKDPEYFEEEFEDNDYYRDCKFTCEPSYIQYPDGHIDSDIFVGNEFSQDGCVLIVSDFVNRILIPKLKAKCADIAHLVKLWYGGDGDEGILSIDIRF